MPKNKNAQIRYRIINDCLKRKHKKWTTKTLSIACGDQLREYLSSDIDNPCYSTIKKDIATMRNGALGYTAPIKWNQDKQTYEYTDPDFSIHKIPITKEEIDQLNQTLQILRQFEGLYQVKGLEEIITKLDHTIREQEGSDKKIIQFDEIWNKYGKQWINTIYQAIYQKRSLNISYQPFSHTTPNEQTVCPLLLKSYNRRWFLIAYNTAYDTISTLALDRIKAVQNSNNPYQQPSQFSADQYFQDIIGVTLPPDATITTIIIRTTPQQAKYIQTKPMHRSQQLIASSPEGSTFQIRVKPNYELETQLLSFGETIEILSPDWLRAKIADRIRKASLLY